MKLSATLAVVMVVLVATAVAHYSSKTCSPGQYRYNHGRSCRSCRTNTYSSGGKSSSCRSCRPGTYSNRGARKCTSCPAGKYNSRYRGSCFRCRANTYSRPGAKSCTKCPRGTRSSSGAQTCSVGLARVENNVAYWGANIKSFRSKGVQDCYNKCRKRKGCASFTMRKSNGYCWLKKKRNGANRSTGVKSRMSVNMVQTKLRKTCSSGQYSYNNGKSCRSCSLNTYSSGGKSSSCKSCRPGTYSNRGARKCTSCAAGTYNSRYRGSCRRCRANTYSRPGAKSCTKCPKGTRSSNGAQSCSVGLARVENNVYYWGATIKSFQSKGVQDCYNKCRKQKGCASFSMRKTNRYCYLKNKRNGAKRRTGVQSIVSANMVRTKLRKTCSSGQYSYNNGKSCRSCSLNTYSSGGKSSTCKSCRPGTYSNRGARKCTSCPAGNYNSRYRGSCRRCRANTYSRPGAKSCTKCPKGTRSSSGAQTCSVGLARVEDNVDYWGADIRSFRSKGVQDCYNNCRKQKGCASFSMRKTDRYCWLKKKRNGAKRRTGNTSRVSANMVLTRSASSTNSLNSKTEGWIPAGVRTKIIHFHIKSTSLQIQTDSKVGSGDLLWVQFAKLNALKDNHGIRVSFKDPPRFMIDSCTSWADAKFPPSCANKNRVWTITKQYGMLQLYCNGGQIFDLEFAKSTKSTCRNQWSVDTTHIKFVKGDTSSDNYRPLPKICTGLPDSWIRVTTKTQFPVNHGTIIKVSCPGGYVNTGGQVVTCNNNLYQDFDYKSKPLCKKRPVDGGWSNYGTWTACSVKCGGKGTRQRRRSCNKPAPAYGGKRCKGNDKQTAVCYATKACPVYPKQTLTYYGYWGDWGRWNYCRNGGFATNFKQKVERSQGHRDDTALNGICLICSTGGTVCSTVGRRGSWRTSHRSSLSGFNRFRMKYERKQGHRDDTGANAVRLYAKGNYYTYHTSNEGKWGKWSGVKNCKSGTVICGIRTRVERNQGRGDDTGLNGVQFKCCS